MKLNLAKVLPLIIAASILVMPRPAFPGPPGELICPINCDQSRDLYFKDPPMTGEDIRGLQETLHTLGFYDGPHFSGVYDLKTQKAVCDFQTKSGMKADGKVVESTWTALSEAVDRPAAAQAAPPPPQGKRIIMIDTSRRVLTLFNDGEPYRQFPVAVGKYETPSPIGNWKIARKAANWGTGFGSRWMGLNVPWGTYGIHGTNKPYSIGGYQSHGCIRMHNRHVEQLYRWVSAGTPVVIVGNPFRYMDPSYKILRQGERGSAVLEVQRALKRLGYDITEDGIWGPGMEKVVIRYRKDSGLPFDNSVNQAVYKSLGLH